MQPHPPRPEAQSLAAAKANHGAAADADTERKRLDALYAFYLLRARNQIRRALRSAGRAVGADGYDAPAACALLEELIYMEHGAVLTLIELAQAVERGADDTAVAALTRKMLETAVQLTARRTADALLMDQASHRRFLLAPEVGC